MEIGFIDYSHEERNTILSTLKILGEQDTLDELGIGIIRDAFSDILFPGISTLQTRAKYFVLLPYLFSDAGKQAEAGRLKNGQDVLKWINESEDKLAGTLTLNCPNGVGIIGSDAYRNKRTVKIKPSQIYWNGLRVFNILQDRNLSLSSLCGVIYREARRKAEIEVKTEDKGEGFDDRSAAGQGKVAFISIKPDPGYLVNSTIDLSKKEAAFLKERILRSPYTDGSLLRFFIREGMVSDSFFSVPENILSGKLKTDYRLAKEFARFIYGAHVRYNLVFSQDSEAGIDMKMQEKYDAWLDDMCAAPVDLDSILARVPCNRYLVGFCKDFHRAALQGNGNEVDEVVVRRERQVKGSRAKLRKPKEYHYNPNSPAHDYKLEYRFGRAKVIIQDILKGLGEVKDV